MEEIMIELREIKRRELILALIQHRMGFMPIFLKYRDKINPVFRNYFDFIKYYKSPKITMLWIVFDGKKVGQIWIKTSDDYASVARIFVLKKWQNRGIAQQAISQSERIFYSYNLWKLETIMQEKKNCYLYEKMGYEQTGQQKKVNKRMTLIYYEKRKKK